MFQEKVCEGLDIFGEVALLDLLVMDFITINDCARDHQLGRLARMMTGFPLLRYAYTHSPLVIGLIFKESL